MAVAFALVNCEADPASSEVSGRIDAKFRDEVVLALAQSDRVRLSSLGGEAPAAWDIAQQIEARGAHVALGRNCFSACAEFFIPASSVSGSPTTLIGYHGGDFMFDALTRRYFGGVSYVNPARLAWLEQAYDRRGLNRDFYKDVQSRLDIRFVSVETDTPSPQLAVYSKVSFWFPTSRQLRDGLGLRSLTATCADDRACWEPRLVELGEPDEWFVVGDELVHMNLDRELEVEAWKKPEVEIQIAP